MNVQELIPQDAKVVSVTTYSKIFDVSRQTVYDLIKKGEISHIKIGEAIRIPVHEVVQKLEGTSNQ
jgi:excisionase family DNA binding protein